MELKEAKEMLKEMKENATHYKKDITIQSVFEALEDTEKAVDIVLNYIENESIPKEKVIELIKEELKYRNELPENAVNTREMHEYTRLTLVELLGE